MTPILLLAALSLSGTKAYDLDQERIAFVRARQEELRHPEWGLVTAMGTRYQMTEWLAYVAAGKAEDPPEDDYPPCSNPQGYSSDMDVPSSQK